MESLKGKTFFIAGGTGSIGLATAKLLHQSGGRVIISGRNAAKLSAAAAEIGIDAAQTVVMDLSNASDVEAGIAAAGHIDVLINAVGIGIIKPVDVLSHEEFLQSIHTNLAGTFYLVKAVLPQMKQAGKGLIINIPGVLGKVPMAGAAAYSASKYGIVGMMQSIREELKRTQIRITNLFLGGVDSAFWDTIDLRVQKDKMIVVNEAARTVWFLCQQPLSGVVSEMVLQPFNHQAI